MSSKHKKIAAGEFKTHCLKLLDQVNEKRFSLTITKRGKAVAKLVPVEDEAPGLFGCMPTSGKR